jgi:uncharacterized membrane protein
VEFWEYHPALVHFPIAFLIGAVLLDLFAWGRRNPGLAKVVTGLLLTGVLTGALAAAAGVVAFFTGPASHTEESGQIIWWHIGAAAIQLILFALVAGVRFRLEPEPPPTWSRILGLLAAVALLIAGYEGGYIVYHGASGIEPALLAPELKQKQETAQNQAARNRALAADTARTH